MPKSFQVKQLEISLEAVHRRVHADGTPEAPAVGPLGEPLITASSSYTIAEAKPETKGMSLMDSLDLERKRHKETRDELARVKAEIEWSRGMAAEAFNQVFVRISIGKPDY